MDAERTAEHGQRSRGKKGIPLKRTPFNPALRRHKACPEHPTSLWEPACRRLPPRLQPRPRSLPWQLPQRERAVTARPASPHSDATRLAPSTPSHCGSRHAGDCHLGFSCGPGRCHGSSHSERGLSLPDLQARTPTPQGLLRAPHLTVGAGMPATATSASAATPVVAMAAPTAREGCHCQICNRALQAHKAPPTNPPARSLQPYDPPSTPRPTP